MSAQTVFYKLFNLKEVEDVLLLANWLQQHSDRNPESRGVAVALHLAKRGKGGELALATKEEVCLIDLKSPVADALVGVLRAMLLDQPQVSLLGRDTYADLVDLVEFFHKRCGVAEREAYDKLAPAFVGDLRQAMQIVGYPPVGKSVFKHAADDAYAVALMEPQYTANPSTQYYSKVSLPAARMWAESKLFRTEGKPDWLVSYSNLWLKVLAHYSSDPTLIFALYENRDALETVARALKVTATQAQSLLLWQVHNREVVAMAKRFPAVVDDLPDSLPKWGEEIDKHFPTLAASTIHMRQAYQESRAAHTLYGRKMRPGYSYGGATAFRIFGTVEDILSVAAVSFWQSRTSPDILVSGISGSAAGAEVQIQGQGPIMGKDLWRRQLDLLSPLQNPMQVSLNPRCVVL